MELEYSFHYKRVNTDFQMSLKYPVVYLPSSLTTNDDNLILVYCVQDFFPEMPHG
jgi:hypothetical protein